jgi:hypothetical protein
MLGFFCLMGVLGRWPCDDLAPIRDLPRAPKSGIVPAKAELDHQGANPIGPNTRASVMIRLSVALVAILGLAACGGGSRYSGNGYRTPVVLFATGPIQQACQSQGRKAASRARCGCVQAVADRSLSSSEQRRGASYFKDPHRLQEVRQNQENNASNRRFWAAWKAFGQQAEQLCAAT